MPMKLLIFIYIFMSTKCIITAIADKKDLLLRTNIIWPQGDIIFCNLVTSNSLSVIV